MSASNSFVRVWVLKRGVVTKPKREPTRKTSGSTAVSPIPRTCHFAPPPAEGPIQRPSQKDEEDDDENREKEQVLGNVMENVVPHLMAHHRLNLFGRSAPQKVVVKRDAHGLAIAADVCAHARGLARGVHLVDLLRRNSISASEAQDRLGDPRIIQHPEFVQQRKNEDRCDHDREDHENDGNDGAPDRPTARPAADHANEQDREDSKQYDVYQQYLEL